MTPEKKLLAAFDFVGNHRNWIRSFYDFDVVGWEKLLREKGEAFWQDQGARRALRLFHAAAERVPAYGHFLKKQRIRHRKIRTMKDFETVPVMDKRNYIEAYSLSQRCWDGKISKSRMISVSSGTSGEPKFWPRQAYQEFEAAVIHELLYCYTLGLGKRSTLMLICFPMGVYVSGVATILPSWLAAERIPDLTLASVGNNKGEVLKLVRSLQSAYEQLVLVGHPFFIKDVIETGKQSGINWSRSDVKLVFCSEGFNEIWRQHLLKQIGASPGAVAVNTYGSSELLLIGHETPESIAIRSVLEKRTDLQMLLTGERLTPNLFQYNPFFRYIEVVNGELVFTSLSGVPLIRFNLHDSGQLFSYKEMRDLPLGAKKSKKLVGLSSWQLPFVALRGRSDATVVFYAANIYPEHIHSALHHPDLLPKLTGRFRMRKDYLKNLDQFLEINIELRPGIKPGPGLAKTIQAGVVEKLKAINMEYLFLCQHLDKNITPRIKLWPHQHEKYFRPGLKPRYI